MSPTEGITYRPEWGCFICAPCGYGVRPQQVRSHWKDRHSVQGQRLRTIKEYCDNLIVQWNAEIPREFETAEPLLLLYRNALQCQVDTKKCLYICRDERNMRQHCRTEHSWSQFKGLGRPSNIVRERVRNDEYLPWITVSCQRIFPSGRDSHFIAVRSIPAAQPKPPTGCPVDSLLQKHKATLQSHRDIITSSYGYDDDRWLKRTGWREFLNDTSRSQVIEYVSEPKQSSSPPYEAVIWDAVSNLLKRSEKRLIRTNHFVLVAVVQVEEGHHIPQPLQPYQDMPQFQKGIKAWQQITLLFVRHSVAQLDLDLSLSQSQLVTLASIIATAQASSYDSEEDDDGSDSGDDGSSASTSHKTAGTGGSEETATPLSKLEGLILSFIISLLDFIVRGWEYESPLVCSLALIATQPQGWLGIGEFPSILSALIKTSRYLVIQKSYEDSSVSRSSRSSGPTLEDVEVLCRRFMRRGTRTPFEWMFDLRSYGLHLAIEFTSMGKLTWKGDQLSYGDMQLDISQLRRMVSLLTFDTRQILNVDLLFNLRTPAVPLPRLGDYPACSTPGFNFLNYRPNIEILKSDRSDWLSYNVYDNAILRKKFWTDRTASRINASAAAEYFSNLHRFRCNLAVLAHITSGQPARVPELLSIRQRNSYEGEQRGVFLDCGLINLTTSYYKGSTIASRADVKIIQRFLPASVSLLVVRYLWLVLPWVELLETQFYGRPTVSVHLWPVDTPNHRFDGTSFRTKFERITERYLGCAVNISSYRHIAIAISRRFLPKALQFEDLQEDSDEAKDVVTSALDAQASHSSYVAQLVYGRESQILGGSLLSRHEQFRTVSKAWHTLLECDVAVKHESEEDSLVPEELVVRRWERLRSSNPFDRLRQLYGVHAVFRTKQEEILRAVYDGISPILAVMPTGSGKSLSFLLPASYEFSGITIVIVPMVSLAEDLLHRSTALSILTRIWTAGATSADTGIVITTPESAKTQEFLAYVHRLRTTGRIDRIVFDECHMFSESDITFRPAIQELTSLFQFSVRLVFLTATLPVGEEMAFWKLLGLQRVPVRTIRASTNRPNLQYRVSYEDRANRVAAIEGYIQSLTSGKVIIYCRYTWTVRTVAARLGCDYYYSSYDQKSRVLKEFRTKDRGVMVATNALGLGVDIPDVRLVIHLDAPDSLVAYMQESGRAGRDGSNSRCLLFADRPAETSSSNTTSKRSYEEMDGHVTNFWLKRYISQPGSATCRRTVAAEYLDGDLTSRDCSDFKDSIPCDVCEEGSERLRTKLSLTCLGSSQRPSPSRTEAQGAVQLLDHQVELLETSQPTETLERQQDLGSQKDREVPKALVTTPVVRSVPQATLVRTDIQQATLPRTEAQRVLLPCTEVQQATVVRTEVQQATLPRTEVQQATLPRTEVQQATLPRKEVHQLLTPQATQQAPEVIAGHNDFQVQARKADFVRQEVQATRIEKSITKDYILRWVETLRTKCYKCQAGGLDDNHPGSECSQPLDPILEASIVAIRRTIKYDRYSCCFSCGMPQEICRTFVRASQGWIPSAQKKSCNYGGRLHEAAAILVTINSRTDKRIIDFWKRRGVWTAELEMENDQRIQQRLIGLLGKKTRWFNFEANMLFRTTASWYLDIHE